VLCCVITTTDNNIIIIRIIIIIIILMIIIVIIVIIEYDMLWCVITTTVMRSGAPTLPAVNINNSILTCSARCDFDRLWQLDFFLLRRRLLWVMEKNEFADSWKGMKFLFQMKTREMVPLRTAKERIQIPMQKNMSAMKRKAIISIIFFFSFQFPLSLTGSHLLINSIY